MNNLLRNLKNLFIKKHEFSNQPHIPNRYDPVTDFVDDNGVVTKSAVVYNKLNERFLKLEDSGCALVIHPGGKVEVVFTKLYDAKDQRVTAEEETLMSIAVFLRQPGFAEMLRNEFHNIAMDSVSKLTNEQNGNN